MTPNGLRSRLDWVARTYERRPVVPYVVGMIALYATGHDRIVEESSTPDYDPTTGTWGFFGGEPLHAAVVVDVLMEARPERTAVDPIVPWLAKTVARLADRVERAPPPSPDAALRLFVMHTQTLIAKGAAIAQWAEATRPNLMGMGLREVLEHVETFEVEVDDIPQGDVVFKFGGGWTLQELDRDALEVEGHVMGHCVGDYCEAVDAGESIILSLRDPNGRPHVTIEFDDEHNIHQIMGKQNERPIERYADMLADWLETLSRSQRAQGLAHLDRVRGADIAYVNLGAGGPYFGVDFTGAKLDRATILETRFEDCVFDDADLRRAELVGTRFEECDLQRTILRRADARGTHFYRCSMTDADLQGADLASATVFASDLTGVDLRHAELARVALRATVLVDARLDGASLEYVRTLEGSAMRGVSCSECARPVDPRVNRQLKRALSRARPTAGGAKG